MPLTSEEGRDYIRLTATIIFLIDRFTPLAHYHTNPSVGSPTLMREREDDASSTYKIDVSDNKNSFIIQIIFYKMAYWISRLTNKDNFQACQFIL